jgi:histidinol dehydrogenase
MKIIQVADAENFSSKVIPKQPQKNKKIVESILNDVKKNGDVAIKKYERKFSKANLKSILVSKSEIKKSYSLVSQEQIQAIKIAKNRLEKTENSLKSILKNKTIFSDGIKIQKNFLPIPSVGCYVPGGLAKYPSSVIMSVIPAKIAGVKRVVVVSPPNTNGEIDPLTIVTSDICGADEIYKVGGVQAIAALSYGTKSIPKVTKIVGPGGAFVTAAKFLVSDQTSIDMLAGPTELGILADETANPKFIAIDLISQAEHSQDTFCYLITDSKNLATEVNKNISEIILKIKRNNFVKTSLKQNGFIAICRNQTDMIKLANELAPEHLQIMTKNSQQISSKITSAGLILLGEHTPSSASDYLLGSNHILPTGGFGRSRGSLSVLDFMKISTNITTSKSVLKKLAKHLEVLTNAEGLSNHYEAIRGRLE